MKKVIVLLGLISSLAGLQAQAQEAKKAKEQLVRVSISKAYIPQGFDNNDITKVVIEGYFPNTCYRIKKQESGDIKINSEDKTIEITQRAYLYEGNCLMMMVPYSEIVEVGKLESVGDYKISDALSKNALGKMAVKEARNKDEADDYFYAMVSDAYMGLMENDEHLVILRGELPGNCWAITDKQAFMDGQDVVTILPIMTKSEGSACTDEHIPFVTTVKLPPLHAGKFLLNVRSLNGQAINRLFDVR